MAHLLGLALIVSVLIGTAITSLRSHELGADDVFLLIVATFVAAMAHNQTLVQ